MFRFRFDLPQGLNLFYTRSPEFKMKKISIVMAFVVGLFAFTGCSPKLEVRFSSLPGQVPQFSKGGFENKVPAPVTPAGGFVYIQTGLDEKASVLGPYAVTPGSALIVPDFPKGEYKRLVLLYTPSVPSPTGLPLTAESDAEFWEKAAAAGFAGELYQDSAAAALFGDIKMKPGRKTILQASLVPLTSMVFNVETQESPLFSDTAGAVCKRFIKLETGTAASVYATLSTFDGEGLVYAGTISLYAADGTLVDTKNFNKHIDEDLPEAVLFSFHGQKGPFYLYLEYIATGSRRIPLVFY